MDKLQQKVDRVHQMMIQHLMKSGKDLPERDVEQIGRPIFDVIDALIAAVPSDQESAKEAIKYAKDFLERYSKSYALPDLAKWGFLHAMMENTIGLPKGYKDWRYDLMMIFNGEVDYKDYLK